MNALSQYLSVSTFISANRSDEISSAFREKFIPKNDFFLKAGHVSDEFFFMEKGFLRAYTFDTDGREFGRSILVKGYVSLKERLLSLINENASFASDF